MKKKLAAIEKIFTKERTERELYKEIISFGERATPFPESEIKKENLVKGCQSELYLTHRFEDGKLEFFIQSEALISKGLAALLVYLYTSETPKILFTNPPVILKTLPILGKISMHRQTGISNLFNEMRSIAAKYI
ncbi:MAG: Cysteine desulfuration protein SufE [Chlamydiia bacterium]|nr:Cysteine desulfuration protein SufE [Chlamydiia bacterium]MCH9618629.1 Cysteine desulfuration protein SufE [Chlamydiia bacterium]MCH9624349.1 Cysteine desulfuration protein SufE [Chlamydiia bacterium]